MSRTARVAAVVCAAIFMSSLDLFIVNIAFPQLADEFGGASRETLSWVLNAYAIVFAALLVPAGRLADLIGRKRVFIAGLLIFTAASAICAAAGSVGVLIAARALQAVGAAALLPTSLALLLPEFPPAKRGAAVGIWAAVGGAAAAAGPPLGGLLVEASWRWVFLVNVPIGILTAIVAVRVLRETREPAGQRLPDVGGALLLMAAITALALAIVEGERWGWGSTPIVALFAAAVLLTTAFVMRSSRHPSPVVELALLRERPVAAANVGALDAAAFVPVWSLTGALALATAVAFAALGRVRARGAAEQAAPRTVAISAGSA